MGVYKEAVHAIQTIESNSRNIYPDAADFGVPVKKDDVIWNLAKQLVDWYRVEGTRKQENYSTGTSVSEIVEYAPVEERGAKMVRVRVNYVTVRGRKDMDGYIYVERL